MDGVDLKQIFLKQNAKVKFSENFYRYTLQKVALGLRDIHKLQIIHGYIRAENILCNTKGDIKITGLSQSILAYELQIKQKYRMNNDFDAPEILNGQF